MERSRFLNRWKILWRCWFHQVGSSWIWVNVSYKQQDQEVSLHQVAVDIGKSTGCKHLIEHFSRLGLSITPDELYRFKQSAIEDSKSEVENHEERADEFKQWVADNVDHNIATLTGKEIFHGMGIICVKKKQAGWFWKVPRLKNRLPAAVPTESRVIEIVPYQQSSQIRKFRFEPISAVTAKSLNSDPGIRMSTCDLLWHFS